MTEHPPSKKVLLPERLHNGPAGGPRPVGLDMAPDTGEQGFRLATSAYLIITTGSGGNIQ